MKELEKLEQVFADIPIDGPISEQRFHREVFKRALDKVKESDVDYRKRMAVLETQVSFAFKKLLELSDGDWEHHLFPILYSLKAFGVLNKSDTEMGRDIEAFHDAIKKEGEKDAKG